MPRSQKNGTRAGASRQERGGAGRRAQGGAGAGPRLEERTRLELYELARELRIAGRAEMSKSELVEAIRRR